MSCAAGAPSFRLLDGYVGWDEAAVEGLAGLDDAGGVRLEPLGPPGGGVEPAEVDAWLPPPRLAYDCRSCTWYLATPAEPARLLRLGPCDGTWRPLALDPDRRPGLVTALAAQQHQVAAADPSGQVWVFGGGGRLRAVFAVPGPVALAFASACELLVAAWRGKRLLRYDLAGVFLGRAALPNLAGRRLQRLAVAADGATWLVLAESGGGLSLWRAGCGDSAFAPATLEELAAAFPPTGLTTVGPAGFCLQRRDDPAPRCFSWFGRPATDLVPPPPPSRFVSQGQLLTGPLDSGVPRCRWHRVRIDADVPAGTAVALAVVASESPALPQQGVADGEWAAFAPGLPHPADWHEVPGALDFLVDQPPGRYLFVRLRLTGDGVATPVVRRVRLDFPRAGSLDFLPEVYREEPRAEDFSERFLALFDAALEDLDRTVERLPALFDVHGVPDEALPWLGRFLDAIFDPAWDAARRRRILAALPALFPRRGTVGGLVEAVRLVFDVTPAIEELGAGRPWAAVAAAGGTGSESSKGSPLDARLGAVRLFGRSRARFRLGSSPLGGTVLRSWGDPDLDPLTDGAYRVRLRLPAAALSGSGARRRLERLVASQQPAHTVVSIETGSASFTVGGAVAVGIDTVLSVPTAPPLGGGLRLRRNAFLQESTP